jgi:hypothetical protein
VAHSYQIFVDSSPVDVEVYGVLSSLIVEEHAELPGAIQLTLPIAADGSGDVTRINDDTFRPYAKIAVVVTPEGGTSQCIFDGFILSHKIHFDRGLTASTLDVWGQDASWSMNQTETVQEWPDIDDTTVANDIFGKYQIDPAPENASEPVVTHSSSGHTLMQRASDIQFLRQLARRNGRLCRVVSTTQPDQLLGYFAKPKLDGPPTTVLTLNDPNQTMLSSLDIEWDVTRPTEVDAAQALFTDDADVGASDQRTDTGLSLLGDRGLPDFVSEVASPAMLVMLTTVVDAADDLDSRTTSVLREASFFVRCTGEVDLSAVSTVLRVNTLVGVSGVGAVHSGNYYVWSVRHTITQGSYRMGFVLVRNAVGSAPS